MLTCIALNVLYIVYNVITCINSVNIISIVFDDMVEKPSVSVFQNFLQIENQLNIKEIIGRNVWM